MTAFATLVRTPERQLALAAVVIAAATGALALAGGLANWQYYLTVDECRAGTPALLGKRLRVSGTIAPRSLAIEPGRTAATFRLEGAAGGLAVCSRGAMLPDNLAEGVQVVVEGRLDRSGAFRAEQVLTRCASKYESLATPPAGAGRAP